jgi:hypothetical protein
MVSFLEVDLSQGNPQNFSLHVIDISQLEKGFTEFPVPPDAVQKLVDRYHLQLTAVETSPSQYWCIKLRSLFRRKPESGKSKHFGPRFSPG